MHWLKKREKTLKQDQEVEKSEAVYTYRKEF